MVSIEIGFAQFPAEAGQGHRDGATEGIGVLVPHPLEELLGADDGAVGAEQDFQEPELLAVERDRRARPADPPAGPVEDEVSPHGDRGVGGTSARRGVDTGHELLEGEGLGQIVVGPQIEALDPVMDRGGRRQHEDACLGGCPHQRGTHGIAVHLGEVAVEDDDVVAGHEGLFDTAGTVVGHVGPDPLVAQSLADVVGEIDLILDDEYPHWTILPQGRSHAGHKRSGPGSCAAFSTWAFVGPMGLLGPGAVTPV